MAYSILLVDDEQPSVEAMCDGIAWEKIKIGKVYTAFNSGQARRIIANNSVDLIICDIEMPQEDGLSLISWVHENYPDIVNILLTCHADFSYAQRGVKAGVFDYLLKPTPYEEMEETISHAVARLETQRQKKDYEKTLENKKSVIFARFLQDLLKGALGESMEDILNQAGQWNISIDVNKTCLLLDLNTRRISSRNGETNSSAKGISRYVTESFPVREEETYILPAEENETLILLFCPPGMDWKEIRECCRSLIWHIAVNMENKPCLYCARPRIMAELSTSFAHIRELIRANIAYDGVAYFEDDKTDQANSDPDFDFEGGKELLLRGQGEKLFELMKKYIYREISARRLSEDRLLLFYHNFIQLLYSTLTEKQISVKSVFAKREILVNYRENFAFVEEMLNYIHEVILTSVELMEQSANKYSIIRKAEEYIQAHICEEISRDELAEHVYLNSEYLSRLFRKETGLSLKEYITDLKLKKAKEMFLTTKLQVTEVACQVGYTNLPYFSKIFKDYTGMTPNEFRRGKQ